MIDFCYQRGINQLKTIKRGAPKMKINISNKDNEKIKHGFIWKAIIHYCKENGLPKPIFKSILPNLYHHTLEIESVIIYDSEDLPSFDWKYVEACYIYVADKNKKIATTTKSDIVSGSLHDDHYRINMNPVYYLEQTDAGLILIFPTFIEKPHEVQVIAFVTHKGKMIQKETLTRLKQLISQKT